MKNVLLVVDAVLAIAVIVLFALVLGGKSQEKAGESVAMNDSLCTATLPIAYINVDSLLLNYQFAKDANEILIRQEEDSRLTFNTKARQLQEEVADFQTAGQLQLQAPIPIKSKEGCLLLLKKK